MYCPLSQSGNLHPQRSFCFAKEKRIRLGGRNQHLHQCERIPDAICPANHKIQLECYKTYVLIFN